MDSDGQLSQQQETPQLTGSQVINQGVSQSSLPKLLLLLLGVIIVLGFISGGYYLAVKRNSSAPSHERKPATILRAQSIIHTPSPTVKGRTYTNNQFGYTIIYPADWQALEAPPPPVTYPPITEQPQVGGYLQKGELQKTTFVNSNIGSCSLSVLENPNHMDLNQWVSSYKALSATGANLAKVIGNTTLSGILAKTISIFAFDHNETAIVTEQNNDIYFFEYSNTKGNPNYNSQQQTAEAICLQMASAFQFLQR